MSTKSTIPSLLKIKDYVTLTGTIIGILALICGSFGTRDAVSLGFFLISITLGTDLIDGYIARKTGTVNEMGKELDSLSDSLTFGIVPAFLTFQAFKTGTYYDIILIIGSICFALGAILRLARFNIIANPGYTGVPTPVSCLLMIGFFFINYFYAFAYGGLNYPFLDLVYYSVPFLLIFIGWLNITTHIKFGEKGKSVYIMFMLFAPLSPIFGIIGILNPTPMVSIIVSIIFLIAFFLMFGWVLLHSFLLSLLKKRKQNNEG
ncbi:MAG: CDP-alcohol phosphatidyltransferase family protein [Candidatus Lokiarchaeota archaeon]|nr:CDP-alcohol phosphatidyltransferase family protein [Candidatus Lokiarchaeota archaeon]